MSKFNQSFAAAMQIIQNARPMACLNTGFEKQLRQYEAANYNAYEAQKSSNWLNPARHRKPRKGAEMDKYSMVEHGAICKAGN